MLSNPEEKETKGHGGGANKGPSWSREETELLLECLERLDEYPSKSALAAEVGDIVGRTENSVMGKIHRIEKKIEKKKKEGSKPMADPRTEPDYARAGKQTEYVKPKEKPQPVSLRDKMNVLLEKIETAYDILDGVHAEILSVTDEVDQLETLIENFVAYREKLQYTIDQRNGMVVSIKKEEL